MVPHGDFVVLDGEQEEEEGFEGLLLSPRRTAEMIMTRARNVKINHDGLQHVAKLIYEHLKNDGQRKQMQQWREHVLHPQTPNEDAIATIFLIDCLNFSFWPDEGQKYTISYNGTPYTGYFALCAAVKRAIDNGIPLADAQFMSNVTIEQLDEIFKTDNDGPKIPLLHHRLEVLHEAGNVLIQVIFHTVLF